MVLSFFFLHFKVFFCKKSTNLLSWLEVINCGIIVSLYHQKALIATSHHLQGKEIEFHSLAATATSCDEVEEESLNDDIMGLALNPICL